MINRTFHIKNINMKKLFLLALMVAISLCWKPQYTISLEYARREGFSEQTSRGEIFWNGQHVLSLGSPDLEVKFASVNVYAKEGDNFLQLRGAGISDAYGLTVDNIRLVKEGTT